MSQDIIYAEDIEIYQSISAQIKDELAQSPDVEALKLSNTSVLEEDGKVPIQFALVVS